MVSKDTDWPRKVFLESNALFRLGARLENVEFAELLRLRDLLGFELCIAEVSWREYLRYRAKEIRDCLSKLRQCRAELGKHGQATTEIEQAEEKASAHLQNARKHFTEKAETLQITIVPTASIEVRTLLEMSLANDPPFEDSHSEAGEKTKEKGFRDALIMFTVMDTIKDRPQDNTLIITDDKRLTDALCMQAPKHGTKLDVGADFRSRSCTY